METTFRDRREAGRVLAERLSFLRSERPIVVGIAPGGVPVAYEVASALDAPLDGWAVCRLQVADAPELHLGAIAEDERRGISIAGASPDTAAPDRLRELAEAHRPLLASATELLRARARIPLRNETVILVDDGVATGASIRAAVAAIRQEKPRRVIAASPVFTRAALANVDPWVDDVVCVVGCEAMENVAASYVELDAVPDALVTQLLDRRRHELGPLRSIGGEPTHARRSDDRGR